VKGGPQTWDEFQEKPVSVKKVCISHDGTHIAAVFGDGTLCVYDAATGQAILPPFKVDKDPRSVILSWDGNFVATGGQALRLWDVQTGLEVESFDIDVHSLALSPDGTYIAAGCGGKIRRRYRSLLDYDSNCSYNIRIINLELALSPSPPDVLSGWGIKNQLKDDSEVWGTKQLKGEVRHSPFEGHKGPVKSIAYSADGNQIASGSNDFTVRVWDVLTGERRTFRTDSEWTISVAFSPDGTEIAANAELINLSTGSSHNIGGSVNSSAFSPDGRFIALGVGFSEGCHIWGVSTTIKFIVELIGHHGDVYSVAFFPGRNQIVSASADGTIRAWDVELLEERGEMDGWRVDSRCWILGPEGECLFYTPLPFRHTRNTLVIGRCPEIDFSNFVHEYEWVKCREPLVEQKRQEGAQGMEVIGDEGVIPNRTIPIMRLILSFYMYILFSLTGYTVE
jgi:WD40 repeat protein